MPESGDENLLQIRALALESARRAASAFKAVETVKEFTVGIAIRTGVSADELGAALGMPRDEVEARYGI